MSDEYGPCDSCGKIERIETAPELLGSGKFCSTCIRSAVAQEQGDGSGDL